ncbi:hypothetical protein Q1695_015780 [Nippostrongylus brasiliensis]|nr:hypothetical protein Q1695_015780 [Nippostrongylus brasiliensis]
MDVLDQNTSNRSTAEACSGCQPNGEFINVRPSTLACSIHPAYDQSPWGTVTTDVGRVGSGWIRIAGGCGGWRSTGSDGWTMIDSKPSALTGSVLLLHFYTPRVLLRQASALILQTTG